MISPFRFASSVISLRKSFRFFSFASNPETDGLVGFFDDRRLDATTAKSAAYHRSMFRRPATVKPWKLKWNSCSFIGTVVRPVTRYAGRNPRLGVYTFLEVKRSPRDSDSSYFQILIAMRGRLSEISLRYVRPNDFIYVCGLLCSYQKVDASGKREIFYKVAVAELNFVKRSESNQICKPESSGEELAATTPSAFDHETVLSSTISDNEEAFRDRLRLWQVFFASPYEWWDNRQDKQHRKSPDFRHKSTRECLSLKPDDPPWVTKQLQLYDSKMARGPHRQSDALEWKLTDFE